MCLRNLIADQINNDRDSCATHDQDKTLLVVAVLAAALAGESEIVGAIIHECGDCQVLSEKDVPELSRRSGDEIGRRAVEVLVADNEAMETAWP